MGILEKVWHSDFEWVSLRGTI